MGVYRIIAMGQALGVGVADSHEANIAAIAKPNGKNAPYCIPNEVICSGIGRFLGLPLPPSGVIHVPGRTPDQWFASFNFNLTGSALPPVDPAKCVATLRRLSTGLVLFDALVLNSDRHAKNFAVDALAKPIPAMSIFDHSHALLGSSANAGSQRLLSLGDRLGITGKPPTGGHRHCLLDHLDTDEHFPEWLERISQIPDFFIEDLCEEVLPYGVTPQEVTDAIVTLKSRRLHMRRIVNDNRAEFTVITSWGRLA